MKKRNKIIITMLMVITMLSVMAVSTFASGDVLKGEEIPGGIDTTDIIGTWRIYTTPGYAEKDTSYNLTFSSNNNSFTSIQVYQSSGEIVHIYYRNDSQRIQVYKDYWSDANYQIIEVTAYDEEQKTEILEFLNANATKTGPDIPSSSSVGILDVASEIPLFLVNVFVPLISIFYADGAFTIIGVLSLAAFAFFLILLLFQVIKRFVQFRG